MVLALLAGDLMQHVPENYRERLAAREAEELADQVFGAWLRSHAPGPPPPPTPGPEEPPRPPRNRPVS
jgi:hypothetical protein